jgi:hypothetical protein
MDLTSGELLSALQDAFEHTTFLSCVVKPCAAFVQGNAGDEPGTALRF